MKSCCSHFCMPDGERSAGRNHHKRCPNYETEEFPYLMYYEEAIDAWTFAPDKVDGQLIVTEDQLEDGEDMEVRFKRVDLTDKEFDEIPVD